MIRSFGIIPVRKFGRQYRFLLVRAYANWDFPKGRMDREEAPLHCALRELREETNLEEAVLCWGEEYVETAPYSHGKIARYYLAEIPKGEVRLPVSQELGRPENDEFRWVSAEEAERLLPPRLQPVLHWARERLAGKSPPFKD